MNNYFGLKTDQELVKQALLSPESFALVIKKYEQPLLRYILRLGLTNIEDARDVLQEAFIKIYVNLNDYDDNLKFSSWVYRIVHNETMGFFRKKKVRPNIAIGNNDETAFLDNIRDDIDIAGDIDKKILSTKVDFVISKIDKKYREPLMLKFLEDKSYEEISDILQVPLGTVATLISRGKQKLKKEIIKNNILQES
jgi:RNA polymerase sigma-70 factor (ECF subfamily)